MDDAGDILEKIIMEFPQKKKEITLMYTRSSDFIDICEDYIVCLDSINVLKQTKNKSNEKSINELQAVFLELREELMSMI